jgi:acetyl-CoA carboxylase biotin carboxylase subunit
MSRSIRRILVANRGEIAVRVMRACRELGISCVAVASEADRFSLHAQLANEVVEIGEAEASKSYLVMEKILEAARSTGCDAIHPGYGFLAENAQFAAACNDAGLIFIGPTPEVIEEMGLKTRARARMEKAGVPVVPGALLEANAPPEASMKAAESVGFPLLVKASAGGGGKGMRAVHEPKDLADALAAARREALSAFGNEEVYLERLLTRPRHIEVQVLGDTHGNVLHLRERECSIQRRHQKIIEESPAPELDDALRSRMHETAVKAASAVSYTGAGTVEMLLDESGEFFFLEMNTRLQVEHPITEWVTGVDLVAQQIRVAEGKALTLKQEDINSRGHSIEARLYAEDPAEGFMPRTGKVLLFEAPGGPGVRVDTGITTGAEISLYYDPLIAKLSTWAEDRESARHRMLQALRETTLLGVGSNLSYLHAILAHPQFAQGHTHTGFLEQHFKDWKQEVGSSSEESASIAAAATILARGGGGASSGAHAAAEPAIAGPWSRLSALRLGGGK